VGFCWVGAATSLVCLALAAPKMGRTGPIPPPTPTGGVPWAAWAPRGRGGQWCNRLLLMEDAENGAEAPVVSDHHMMIEEGQQEAAIAAFLLAHEGHTRDVEVQSGAWMVYCRCRRCEDIRTYEVDNEAREQAIGLPPWPGSKKQPG
jgi:hypothetical protein